MRNAIPQNGTGGALEGVRVIDAATLFAGPLAATILGDFGAEVIKVEHPRLGDPVRDHGHHKDGVGLWWKILGRNKQAITADLKSEGGRQVMLDLVATADVLIENFRPGTLERWGLSPETLHEVNPDLIIARVTGFGQFGPYASRPGFGTLAESMSGFAAITGEPDGPPTLPPFGLADGLTAQTVANAILTALFRRATHGGGGQVLDIAIIEPIVTIIGPHATVYDQLGIKQERTGNRSANNAPRNTYRTADGRWLAISTSAQSIAERVMTLVGHPEVIDEPWFASGAGRAQHGDLLDGHVAAWIAERNLDEVIEAFEQAQAAVAPIYDIEQIFEDPQYRALDTITTIDDPELGPLRMTNVMWRMSETPGSIEWAGRPQGADTDTVLAGLGYDGATIAELRREGAI